MRPLERPAAAPGPPVAQNRAEALQARLLALAGSAPPPREPEPDTGERNQGDGSAERARELIARELGGQLLSDERQEQVTAKDGTVATVWVNVRTGEMRPVA